MSDGAPEAPDTAASSQVTDHPFIRSGRNPFLCGRCSLGEAAHASSEAPVEERPQPIPVAEIDMSEMQEHVVTGRLRCGMLSEQSDFLGLDPDGPGPIEPDRSRQLDLPGIYV